MTPDILKKYVEIHKQGWVPIFVNDALDAVRLAEVCAESGFKAIEVTCRRPRVVEEIRAIRKAFPDLIILAGSVVDDSVLLPHLQARRPDFPDMAQLESMGVDGFVAQLPFSEKTIAAYSKRSILIPGVDTLAEAVASLHAGAHFAKFCSSPPERIRQLASEATHRLIPIFYTGGASLETIRAYAAAGAALIGGGWDLMLSDIYSEMQARFDARRVAERLRGYRQAMDEARVELIPWFAELLSASPESYVQHLVHYHPFAEQTSMSGI